MDFSDIGTSIKKNLLPLALGGSGIVLLLYGLISSVLPTEQKQEILFESSNEASATDSAKLKQIAIDVEGAVMKPGVYKLPLNSRVQDALIKAGGMSDKADRAKVAKGLNLAAPITDGGKIYIPFEGEASTPVGVAGATSEMSLNQGAVGDSTGTQININTASQSELESLPGIGAVTAGKIISSRPYTNIDELLTKKAVGQSVFAKIKDKISSY